MLYGVFSYLADTFDDLQQNNFFVYRHDNCGQNTGRAIAESTNL